MATGFFVKWWRWLRGALLTWRYVDDWTRFPAIWPAAGGRIRMRKAPGARLTIRGRLRLEGYLGSSLPSLIVLGKGSHWDIQGDFTLGDNNRIRLAEGARLEMQGRSKASVSIINSSSLILVRRHVVLGKGVLIGHYCLVTDSDWHPIDGEVRTDLTVLGDECWMFDGAKVLRGVRLGDGCAVTSNSVVLPGEYPAGALLSGLPATIKKQGLRKSFV